MSEELKMPLIEPIKKEKKVRKMIKIMKALKSKGALALAGATAAAATTSTCGTSGARPKLFPHVPRGGGMRNFLQTRGLLVLSSKMFL